MIRIIYPAYLIACGKLITPLQRLSYPTGCSHKLSTNWIPIQYLSLQQLFEKLYSAYYNIYTNVSRFIKPFRGLLALYCFLHIKRYKHNIKNNCSFGVSSSHFQLILTVISMHSQLQKKVERLNTCEFTLFTLMKRQQ